MEFNDLDILNGVTNYIILITFKINIILIQFQMIDFLI